MENSQRPCGFDIYALSILFINMILLLKYGMVPQANKSMNNIIFKIDE